MPRKSRVPEHKKRIYKTKPGVSGKRFRKDPVFKNSRRAMGEFGLASRAATLIRREFKTLIGNIPQNKTHKQLTGKISILVRAKKAAGSERIRLNNLDWQLLRNFEFNNEVGLSALLYSDFNIAIDTDSAAITITLSAFSVAKNIEGFGEISHMRVIAGAAAIDFAHEKATRDKTAVIFAAGKEPDSEATQLTLQLTPPIIHPLFIVLGFACFNIVNGQEYELYNLRSRALCIIHVHPAPPPAYKTKPAPPVKPARPSKKTTTKKSAAKKPAAKTKNRKPSKKPASKKRPGK